MDIKKVDANNWLKYRKDIVNLVLEDFEETDINSYSGEGINELSINIGNYFKDATIAPGSSLKQQAKMFVLCEGRNIWPKFSACSELCHFSLLCLGLRDPRLLNKDDHELIGVSANTWKMGMSVPKLISGSLAIGKELGTQIWTKASPDLMPMSGDLVLIGENGLEHVFIPTSIEDNVIISGDAGQVDLGGQCCAERKRIIEISGKDVWTVAIGANGQPQAAGLGKRRMIGWVSISSLLPKLTGKCLKVK